MATELQAGQLWHTANVAPATNSGLHGCARASIDEVDGDFVRYHYVDVTVLGSFHGRDSMEVGDFRRCFSELGDLPDSTWKAMGPVGGPDLSAASGITYP